MKMNLIVGQQYDRLFITLWNIAPNLDSSAVIKKIFSSTLVCGNFVYSGKSQKKVENSFDIVQDRQEESIAYFVWGLVDVS